MMFDSGVGFWLQRARGLTDVAGEDVLAHLLNERVLRDRGLEEQVLDALDGDREDEDRADGDGVHTPATLLERVRNVLEAHF